MAQAPTRRTILSGASVLAGALTAPPVGSAGAAATPWPNGARAAVSLTYDDALASQLDHASGHLDQFGFKATFFLTKDNIGDRLAAWQGLARAGHEIGNHTVNHPCELGSVSAKSFDSREIEAMEAYLAANFPVGRAPIYAYTCGVLDLGQGGPRREHARYVQVLEKHFQAARAVVGAPNNPSRVMAERFALHASDPTYERDDPALAIDYMRPALASGRWAILVFHEILPRRRGEGDTSFETHLRVLEWIAAQPIWCAPMGQVLRHLGVIPDSPARALAAP